MRSALLLPLLLTASAASADEPPPPAQERPTDEEQPPKRFDAAIKSADAGAFEPYTFAARIEGRATVALLSGYDSAYHNAVGTIGAEARVWGPIAIRAGASWVPARTTIWPAAGLRVQALKQERFGIDLSLGAQYKAEGLTEGDIEGELEGVVAIGRRFGRLGLLANLVFGSDFDGNDRDGEVHLSGQYTITDRLRAGLDSRVRFDLGSNPASLASTHKATLDVVAGPTASVMFGPAIFVATVGYSGVQLYGSSYASGVVAMGGVGAGF
jgi:hypothetical protein